MKILIAKHYGFCHGVKRAIDLSTKAVQTNADKKLFLLNEMIHNPLVNQEMEEKGIVFLDKERHNEQAQLELVTGHDVVIIPAFGTTKQTYEQLKRKGSEVVDTTCGCVKVVWKDVKDYSAGGFTSIIYGKIQHQETIATASYADKFLVILNYTDVQFVCNALVEERWHDILEKFKGSYSQGFNPQTDLQKVGLACQTTMLSNEFIAISDLFKKTMLQKYGEAELAEHFKTLKTICYATQERQDALLELLPQVQMMIVIGGYNSSNTYSLAKMAAEKVPTYHITTAKCIERERIQHKILETPVYAWKEMMTENWLPSTEIIMGVTAGASTPDWVIQEVVKKIEGFSASDNKI